MKRFYKIFASWFLCLFLVLSQFIVSFADVNSLMISSDSNALMTLDLSGDDYAVMPLSSIGTVTNTVGEDVAVVINYYNANNVLSYYHVKPKLVNGRFEFSQKVPGKIWRVDFGFYSDALPSPAGYKMSFDFGSHLSVEYSLAHLRVQKSYENAETLLDAVELDYLQSSGDIYIEPVSVQLGNVDWIQLLFRINNYSSVNLDTFAGSYALHFTRSDVGNDAYDAGIDTSNEDYQSDVSSSLSDLSSSVDSMTDEISGVAEAIQNLQGAMEPHYSNVLTQLHHITEQLHAFYDQIYNNIHLKEYALWQDIKTAIENIDLEVNVNLDKLKSSIDNMSQAIQNKLQSVQDTLTNGFNNSGINQDAAELDQSLQEYEEAEQTVIDQVNDSLNDFEFDSGFEEYTNTIKVFSDFIQNLYEASGGFKVVINLSLMLSIAGIVIGVYRFRDGG